MLCGCLRPLPSWQQRCQQTTRKLVCIATATTRWGTGRHEKWAMYVYVCMYVACSSAMQSCSVVCWLCCLNLASFADACAGATVAGEVFAISSIFRTLFSFEIWICRLHTQCMQLFEATRGGDRVERASDGELMQLHLGSINASKALRSTHSSSDSRRDDDDDDATCRRWSRLAGAGVVAVVVAVAVALWLPQLHPAVFFFRLGHVRDRDKKLRLCLDAVRSSRESGRERENPPIAQAYVILWEVLWIIPKHLK